MSSTDTADEIVEIGLSPPKKRARKRHFDASTKEMILNIYKCEVNEKPGSTVNDVAIKVANKSGVLGTITAQKLENCIQHVQNNIEQKMWDLDNVIEIHVEPLIINVREDSSTSEWDDESE
ncbi:hypothetical protein ILUMI_16536 [Ignelater luminosus]|uniref:Uncharacterized protein n=1 Tax=Ignelater luminosus TaxID=2038154 RepID=A0A8K0CQV2_IGNLU|nr:hypothetical protein ILUMI_16536 [Ignelater luminosus]